MKNKSGLYEVLIDLACQSRISLSQDMITEARTALHEDLLSIEREKEKLTDIKNRLCYFMDRLDNL